MGCGLAMKLLLLSLLLAVAAALTPLEAFAAVYGTGSYGEGNYTVGETPPTPAPNASGANSTDSSSGSARNAASSPSTPTCRAEKPASAPDLFQINAQSHSVTLFFSPASGQQDRYIVSYSTTAGMDQYGFELFNNEQGVMRVEIQALQAGTTYHFKVRAGNGCQPGDWSHELAAKTGQRFPTYRWASLPRIVTTAVAKRVNLTSLHQVEKDTSTLSPVKDEATSPTAAPTPRPSDGNVAPNPVLPSLIDRVVGFIRGLFGK